MKWRRTRDGQIAAADLVPALFVLAQAVAVDGDLADELRARAGSGLPSITSFFVHDDPSCSACHGSGHVCEEHPDRPWDEGDGCCGAAGMPCPLISPR